MADDLDENFQIEENFLPSETVEEDDFSNEDKKLTESDPKKSKVKKKKNITEILKLKQNELKKASLANKELKSILIKYIKTNLSSIEKMDLNFIKEGDRSDLAMNSVLNQMLIKRKQKLVQLESFWKHFNKKFNTKLKEHLKNSSQFSQKHSPFMIILCSSAIRCIQLQRELESHNKLIKNKKLTWFHAFAKHKKLNDQVAFLNGIKSKQRNIDIIYATPQRLFQLIELDCFDLEKYFKYIIIDYSHRDVKLKRFVDQNDIKNEFLNLTFKKLIQLNKNKIKFKFYLI